MLDEWADSSEKQRSIELADEAGFELVYLPPSITRSEFTYRNGGLPMGQATLTQFWLFLNRR